MPTTRELHDRILDRPAGTTLRGGAPLPVNQLHSTDRDRDDDARPAGWRAAFRDVVDEVEASGGTRSSLADSGVAGEGDHAWGRVRDDGVADVLT